MHPLLYRSQFILLGLLLVSCTDEVVEELPPRLVITHTATESAASQARRFSAITEARDQRPIAFQVGGRIDTMHLDVGAVVEQGTPIAELDATDIRLQIAEAQAGLESAEAQARQTAADFKRSQKLFEAGNIPANQFDATEAANIAAQANKAAALKRVARAEQTLGHHRLSSPFSGVVVERTAESTQVVQAGETIVTIADLTSLEIVTGIPEALISAVSPGLPAKVTLNAYGQATQQGVVREIGVQPGGDATYAVRIELTNPPKDLRPGMVGTAEFTFSGTQETGVLVPTAALRSTVDGSNRVWIVKNKIVHDRQVTVGNIVADHILIHEGLQANDVVVIRGVHHLRDQQPVRIREGSHQ